MNENEVIPEEGEVTVEEFKEIARGEALTEFHNSQATDEQIEEEAAAAYAEEDAANDEAERIAKEAEEMRLLEIALRDEKRRLTNEMWHQPTSQHGNRLRGKGVTRKSKEQSKKARKMAKNSRRINRGKR